MIREHIAERFPSEHPRTVAIRERLANACDEFVSCGLADPKFINELTSGSDQKFWACISEALIAELLRDKQFGKRGMLGRGPDFLVLDGDRKIWIEVICPKPVDLPCNWLIPESGAAIDFPHEAILLRWTSAIKAKAEALIGSRDGTHEGYLRSGIVSPDDAYVIAVNGCQLRNGLGSALIGISQFPFAAEAVFPIGPIQVRLDRETAKILDQGHQHRPYVTNKNGSKVPAYTFLDPRFDSISAIWAVDLNGGSAIGNPEPTAVVHNPNAANPVSLGFLPADDEYFAHPEGDNFLLEKVGAK